MADGRNVVTLKCSTCKNQNYFIELGKRKGERTKVKINKFCSTCGKHVQHLESKL